MAHRKRLGPGWLAGIFVLAVIGMIGNACSSKDAGPAAPSSATVPLTTTSAPAYSPAPASELPTTQDTPTSTPTYSLPSDDPVDTGTGSGTTDIPLPDDSGVHVPHIPHPHVRTCVGGKHIHICS
ncbi:hypothetical protein [Amycolatopsis circi]|uniref:hypothetical protein n=1 Tax=Amycolatopsis circi TaxID=871959 RepID=UPI000E2280D8|nr:hypothetical protein [Amycolatopsis circi]